jgi:hypothetical protein
VLVVRLATIAGQELENRLPDVLSLTRAYAANLPCAKVCFLFKKYLLLFSDINEFYGYVGCLYESNGS